MYLVNLVIFVCHFIALVEAELCPGSTPLVVDQVRAELAHNFDFELDSQGPFRSSFSRLALSEEDQAARHLCNEQGWTNRRWLALQLLQSQEPQACHLLRHLWKTLGRGLGISSQYSLRRTASSSREPETVPTSSRCPPTSTESTTEQGQRSREMSASPASRWTWQRTQKIEEEKGCRRGDEFSVPVLCNSVELGLQQHTISNQSESKLYNSCTSLSHQQRDLGSPARCIRGQVDAAGCQGLCQEGPGHAEKISYQRIAFGHQGARSCFPEGVRCHPGKAKAPKSMDAIWKNLSNSGKHNS